jgi:hypothetical protein
MNNSPGNEPQMAWYRVPEMWLMLILLSAMVVGSFALLGEAIHTPDVHIVVPNDVPRPSRIPPINPAAKTTSAPATTRDHGQAS